MSAPTPEPTVSAVCNSKDRSVICIQGDPQGLPAAVVVILALLFVVWIVRAAAARNR